MLIIMTLKAVALISCWNFVLAPACSVIRPLNIIEMVILVVCLLVLITSISVSGSSRGR